MPQAPRDLVTFEANGAEVAQVLRMLANERRLMILCKLVEWGEANVGSLADAVGLSQSALSQHLARMREEGLVAFRRESQTIWYQVADSRVETLLGHLQHLFCPPVAAQPRKSEDDKGKTAMRLATISPADAKRLVDEGAALIDIRGADEYARERIPGARHQPRCP